MKMQIKAVWRPVITEPFAPNLEFQMRKKSQTIEIEVPDNTPWEEIKQGAEEAAKTVTPKGYKFDRIEKVE